MNQAGVMSVIPYRCVCGNAIALPASGARDCGRCGRGVPDTAWRMGDATVIGDQASSEISSVPSDPLLNQKLKHFRILAPLGAGGMGAVYRAVDESLQREVALKVLRPTAANQPEENHWELTRLLQEARAQARVSHPNVVQVYYVDHEDEHPFLAMELVHGETLQDRLRRRQLSFPEIVDVAVQTVKALDAAAQIRIVHGDIKPANLMLTPDGLVKLSDFGLAKPIGQLWENSQPIAGTPNYLSPEGCQGLPTNTRSDMYSLGVMLFEMTFHRLPYALPSESIKARLQAHQYAPVRFPDEWPETIPHAWRALLLKLLAKNPQDRFDNYTQLLGELNRLTPSSLTRANRLVRGMAALADLAPAWAVLELFRSTYPAGKDWSSLLSSSLGLACGGCVLLLVALLQTARRTTLGKTLFHIHVVDDLGQCPGASRLFLRSLLQQAPLWLLLTGWSFADLGAPTWGLNLALLVLPVLVADVLTAAFRRDGRSLHDLWFRSHVVMDTARHESLETEASVSAERNADRGRGRLEKHEFILRERLLSRRTVKSCQRPAASDQPSAARK